MVCVLLGVVEQSLNDCSYNRTSLWVKRKKKLLCQVQPEIIPKHNSRRLNALEIMKFKLNSSRKVAECEPQNLVPKV